MAARRRWRGVVGSGALVAAVAVGVYVMGWLRPAGAGEQPPEPVLALALADSGRILIGTPKRLLALDSAGGHPRELLPGTVNQVLVDPGNPAELYAAGPGIGIVRSPDGGRTWQRVGGRGLPAEPVAALAYDPSGARRLLAAVTGKGLYQSDNGGDSWRQLAPAVPPDLQTLAVSPLNPRIILAGTGRGLYVSTNQGMRFERVDPGDGQWLPRALPGPVRTLAVAGNRSAILAVAGDGIYRSGDEGRTWLRLGDPGLPDLSAVAVAPWRSHHLVAGSRAGAVVRSSDGGMTWEPVR